MAMSRVGSRIPQAHSLLLASPNTRVRHASRSLAREGNGFATAAACVLAALLLYVIATRVFGVDNGTVLDGPFGATVSPTCAV